MNKKNIFAILVFVGMLIFSVNSKAALFFKGTAKATGTVEKGTPTLADIVKKDGTGGLTVKSVEVKDKFGRTKRVNWSVKTGRTSTSPTLEFNPALEVGDYVSVDLETGNDGDHGYLDLKFR